MLLLLPGLVFASNLTDEVTAKCKVEMVDAGSYYGYCPMGSLVDAVRVNHSNTDFTPWTRVSCVKPVITCKEKEETEE